MRFLPHLLAAVLATTTLSAQVASACGGSYVDFNPAPRVLAVSTHHLNPGGPGPRNDRAFVVLAQSSDAVSNDDWDFIAPRTFDATQLAVLSPLATPMEVTLVGPSGTRVVKTKQQVALRRGLTGKQQRLALEVPLRANQEFAIAIQGRASDAKWHSLFAKDASAKTASWLRQQGITDAKYIAVRAIKGTGFELVDFQRNDGNWHHIVRDGGTSVGAAAASVPIGALTTQGRTFVVFSTDQQVSLLELPAATKA
jgi:hypothetical protein